jgi:phosphoribosyl 1,2-cyclic phosphate phosphodiesterase
VIYPALTITFLGTGTSSGVPMVGCDCEVCISTDPHDNRLRSSVLVQSATTTIVVDTTPDFRTQMLREGVKQLDAVLITHPHKDHVAGIDDTRPFQFFNQMPTLIYGSHLSLEGIRKEIPYAFEEFTYPGVPKVMLHEISTEPFMIGDIPVEPFFVWHHRMPVHGFKFGGFTYITDANRIDRREMDIIRNSKIIVLNALRKEKHISHFTLGEAVELVRELNIPQAYFTHISHQLGLHGQINSTLPKGLSLAFDGLKLYI